MKSAHLSCFLALAVLPLLFDMACADPITAPKLACWMVAAGLAALTPFRPWSAAEKVLWLWFSWASLSALYNGLAPGWIELLTIFCALIWGRSQMPGRNRWLAAGFGLTVVYSWVQRLGWDPFAWSHPELSQLRTIAGLGNPNYLAMYLACLFPWAWPRLYRRGWPGWAVAFVSMLALLLTATRGSNLVLSAVFIATALYAGLRQRRITRFWMLGILLLALSWGTSLWISGRRQFALASAMTSLGSGKDYSVIARKLLWQSAWRSGLAHPWLGVGPGHFGDAYLLNRSMEPDVLMKRERRPEDAHNEPLRVLSETGWVGLGLWCGWVMLALRAHLRRPGPQSACLLVLFGNSLTNCFPLVAYPLLMLWITPDRDDCPPAKMKWAGLPILLVGLLLGLAGWKTERTFWWDDEWTLGGRNFPKAAPQLFEQRVRALDVCALYCPPWFQDSLAMRQSAAWQNLAELTGEPLAWQQAERYARQRIDLDPKNPYHWLFLGIVYDHQGKNEQAMEMWREAESRDPLSPQIAFLRARSQHKLGNSGAALQSIQRSLELFSNSRQVYRFRAQIMIEQGRTGEGIEDWVDSQVIDEGI